MDVVIVDPSIMVKLVNEKSLQGHNKGGNLFPLEHILGFRMKICADLPGDVTIQLILASFLQIVAGRNAANFLLSFGPTTKRADVPIDRRTEPVTLPFSTRQTFCRDCHINWISRSPCRLDETVRGRNSREGQSRYDLEILQAAPAELVRLKILQTLSGEFDAAVIR